jgi:hypothetical protein
MHKQAAKRGKAAETARLFAQEEFRGFLANPGTRQGVGFFSGIFVGEGPTI